MQVAAVFAIWALSGLTLVADDLLLRSKVSVEEGFIRLSELVDIPTGSAGKSAAEKMEKYKGVYLGQIKAGEERSLELTYIRRRLVREGILGVYPKTSSGSKLVRVEGVPAVLAQKAEGAEGAEGAGVKETPVRLATVSEDAPLEDPGQFQEKSEPPAAAEEFHIMPANHASPQRQEVWVVKYPLRRGDDFNPEDFERKTVNRRVPNAVNELPALIGQVVDRYLSEGHVLTQDDVRPIPWVERNQWVRIAFQEGAIHISGIGRALEEGHPGDIIDVRRNNYTLRARVSAPKAVEVVGTL